MSKVRGIWDKLHRCSNCGAVDPKWTLAGYTAIKADDTFKASLYCSDCGCCMVDIVPATAMEVLGKIKMLCDACDTWEDCESFGCPFYNKTDKTASGSACRINVPSDTWEIPEES